MVGWVWGKGWGRGGGAGEGRRWGDAQALGNKVTLRWLLLWQNQGRRDGACTSVWPRQ